MIIYYGCYAMMKQTYKIIQKLETRISGATPNQMDKIARETLKQARKIIVMVIGGSVLAAGVALLFLPGPAFVVIPIGLGILATEFIWARNLLKRIRKEIKNASSRIMGEKHESGQIDERNLQE